MQPTTTPFKELNLDTSLQEALDKLGFKNCTPIQSLTLPRIIAGHDVAAQAQTGTGKTAAYLLGSFSKILAASSADNTDSSEASEKKRKNPRVLVIAPTRELAIQIKKDADELGKFTDLRISLVYGGVDYNKQARELSEGVDVLIGTPGRLIDYLKQGIYSLKTLDAATGGAHEPVVLSNAV